MSKITETYAEVVKKHPKLAVFSGGCEYTDEEPGDRALIADIWTEMLPAGHALQRSWDRKTWHLFTWGDNGKIPLAGRETRLEALAAFWLSYEGPVGKE